NFATLFTFNGTNGRQPNRLILGSDGNFYGTTPSSGAADPGTFFKMDSGGNLQILHFFTVAEGAGASYPGLIRGSDSNFYGTALGGGSSACPNGCGTVFKVDMLGHVTPLHTFTGTDGWMPKGGLIQASDGNFYGTTVGGGTVNLGTIFKMDQAGNLNNVHSF